MIETKITIRGIEIVSKQKKFTRIIPFKTEYKGD
jgi:hypothetical protein